MTVDNGGEEVTEANGYSSSPEHDLLWAFVDGDRPLVDEDEAVSLLCTVQSIVARSGLINWPERAVDCFCATRPYRGDAWRNQGDGVRYIARAVREQIRRDQIAAQFEGH